MRKLLALVAAGALLLAACGSGEESLVSPAGADGTITSGINVSGQGKVTGKPDTLTVSLGVSVLRPTVDRATADAASLATAIIDALKANGVAEVDIQTANYTHLPRVRLER